MLPSLVFVSSYLAGGRWGLCLVNHMIGSNAFMIPYLPITNSDDDEGQQDTLLFRCVSLIPLEESSVISA